MPVDWGAVTATADKTDTWASEGQVVAIAQIMEECRKMAEDLQKVTGVKRTYRYFDAGVVYSEPELIAMVLKEVHITYRGGFLSRQRAKHILSHLTKVESVLRRESLAVEREDMGGWLTPTEDDVFDEDYDDLPF